jgi:hypothetical protein
MKITIVAEDGFVVADDESRRVDLSALESTIHAIQWDSVRSVGIIEYKRAVGRRTSLAIDDFSPYQWAYDAWVAADETLGITTAQWRESGHTLIDEAAGFARDRYITTVSGQGAVYMIKADEAQAYKDAGYTGTVPPHIAAEAAETGQTATQIADMVLATRDVWVNTLSPTIEGLRLGGKANVTSAVTDDDIQAASAAAIAALDAV